MIENFGENINTNGFDKRPEDAENMAEESIYVEAQNVFNNPKVTLRVKEHKVRPYPD